mmetsp:Transcript_70158/g.158670  ORF Transcript_70158/g.158670 Transcript_70158/m.158670 type:complete len:307 (-) Transcript_70158:65-985(-)
MLLGLLRVFESPELPRLSALVLLAEHRVGPRPCLHPGDHPADVRLRVFHVVLQLLHALVLVEFVELLLEEFHGEAALEALKGALEVEGRVKVVPPERLVVTHLGIVVCPLLRVLGLDEYPEFERLFVLPQGAVQLLEQHLLARRLFKGHRLDVRRAPGDESRPVHRTHLDVPVGGAALEVPQDVPQLVAEDGAAVLVAPKRHPVGAVHRRRGGVEVARAEARLLGRALPERHVRHLGAGHLRVIRNLKVDNIRSPGVQGDGPSDAEASGRVLEAQVEVHFEEEAIRGRQRGGRRGLHVGGVEGGAP